MQIFKSILEDLFLLGGLGMVGTGLWFVDWRLALVVCGMALMWFGLRIGKVPHLEAQPNE